MKTGKIVAVITLGVLTLSQLALFAQAGPPGPGSGAPIDGGAVILVVGAAAYGYRKLMKENAKIKGQITVCESILEK